MANERASKIASEVVDQMIRERFIERINELEDELERLGVKRERFDFSTMDLDEVRELGIAVYEQLERRRNWLGVE